MNRPNDNGLKVGTARNLSMVAENKSCEKAGRQLAVRVKMRKSAAERWVVMWIACTSGWFGRIVIRQAHR